MDSKIVELFCHAFSVTFMQNFCFRFNITEYA